MNKLATALSLMLVALPFSATAATAVFESTCNDDAPFVAGSTGNCVLFGLSSTDTVTGFFTFDDTLFTPGSGISLENTQYDFLFQFGNQTFTEEDNTLNLTFIVSNNGTTISSIAAGFVNAAGARLNLLTPSTVRIQLGDEGADTFGEASQWAVEGNVVVPIPAAIYLFSTSLAMLVFAGRLKSRKLKL